LDFTTPFFTEILLYLCDCSRSEAFEFFRGERNRLLAVGAELERHDDYAPINRLAPIDIGESGSVVHTFIAHVLFSPKLIKEYNPCTLLLYEAKILNDISSFPDE